MLTNKDVDKLKETFATKEELKSLKEEITRHFDVVAEDIISSNKLVLEQFSTHTEKIANHEERIEKFETVKTDVSIIKTRVIALEAKVK